MTHALRAALRSLLAVAVLGTTCMSIEASACTTIESVATQIRLESPNTEIRLVDGLLANRLQMGISALAGQQVPSGGRYLLARGSGAMTIYVVRFEGACATHHGRFSHELVHAWLNGSPA